LLESRGFTALEPLLDDAAREIIVALDGHSLRGPDGEVTIRPGMQADVELDAGQRTVFQYLFHPLLRAQEAFSEPDYKTARPPPPPPPGALPAVPWLAACILRAACQTARQNGGTEWFWHAEIGFQPTAKIWCKQSQLGRGAHHPWR
ncbi:MAG: hypothetical protein ACO37E_08255, partial [Lutimaribacter sp.]